VKPHRNLGVYLKRWCHTITWRTFEGGTLLEVVGQRSGPDKWSPSENRRSSWIFRASLFLLLLLFCFSLENLIYVMCTINVEIDYFWSIDCITLSFYSTFGCLWYYLKFKGIPQKSYLLNCKELFYTSLPPVLNRSGRDFACKRESMVCSFISDFILIGTSWSCGGWINSKFDWSWIFWKVLKNATALQTCRICSNISKKINSYISNLKSQEWLEVFEQIWHILYV